MTTGSKSKVGTGLSLEVPFLMFTSLSWLAKLSKNLRIGFFGAMILTENFLINQPIMAYWSSEIQSYIRLNGLEFGNAKPNIEKIFFLCIPEKNRILINSRKSRMRIISSLLCSLCQTHEET